VQARLHLFPGQGLHAGSDIWATIIENRRSYIVECSTVPCLGQDVSCLAGRPCVWVAQPPRSSSSLRGEIEVAAGGLWIGVGQACGLLAAGRSRLWRSFQGAGKNFSKHRRLCAQQRKKHPDRKRETRNGRRSPWGLIGKVAMEEIVPRSPSCFVSFGLHDLGLEDNVTTYGSVAEGLEFHTRQRQWEPQIAAGRTADEAAITWSTNC
jgi:hypothetical protein